MIWAQRYARFALAAAFVSAVVSRLRDFPKFIHYTAEVNSFLPASFAPALAVAATVCEVTFAIGMLIGWKLRWFALGAAVLLALFGTAMAISFGIKEPLDYSVFSASACALFLIERGSKVTPRGEASPKGH